jgi:hypothetical protein
VREGLVDLAYLTLGAFAGKMPGGFGSYEIVLLRGGAQLQQERVTETLRSVAHDNTPEGQREVRKFVDEVCGFHFSDEE